MAFQVGTINKTIKITSSQKYIRSLKKVTGVQVVTLECDSQSLRRNSKLIPYQLRSGLKQANNFLFPIHVLWLVISTWYSSPYNMSDIFTRSLVDTFHWIGVHFQDSVIKNKVSLSMCQYCNKLKVTEADLLLYFRV